MLDALERQIAESRRARFGKGVPEQVVAAAEQVMGIAFPPSYRWWLGRYGAGYLGGYELQGLAPVMPSERDPSEVFIGDVVQTFRCNIANGQPAHLVEILNYDGDEIYYLDMSATAADGEAPVVCRSSHVSQVQRVAESFAAFLCREL
jgi:hypothetical protein